MRPRQTPGVHIGIQRGDRMTFVTLVDAKDTTRTIDARVASKFSTLAVGDKIGIWRRLIPMQPDPSSHIGTGRLRDRADAAAIAAAMSEAHDLGALLHNLGMVAPRGAVVGYSKHASRPM